MRHILLVEDDPMNAKVLQKILKRVGGFRVSWSEDVREILDKARSGKVDLILMDVSLTNSSYEGRFMDGVEITRLLKAGKGSQKVPVLLATSYAMKGDGERLIEESGADGYIAKPIVEPIDLINKINGLMSL